MKVRVLSVHPKKENFGYDAYAYRVEIDGKVVAEYRDDYHERGSDRCQGFIDGYFLAKGFAVRPKIEYKEIVDKGVG